MAVLISEDISYMLKVLISLSSWTHRRMTTDTHTVNKRWTSTVISCVDALLRSFEGFYCERQWLQEAPLTKISSS